MVDYLGIESTKVDIHQTMIMKKPALGTRYQRRFVIEYRHAKYVQLKRLTMPVRARINMALTGCSLTDAKIRQSALGAIKNSYKRLSRAAPRINGTLKILDLAFTVNLQLKDVFPLTFLET